MPKQDKKEDRIYLFRKNPYKKDNDRGTTDPKESIKDQVSGKIQDMRSQGKGLVEGLKKGVDDLKPTEDEVKKVVASIVDKARFEYWYIQDLCFRGKVNMLYKAYLLEKFARTGDCHAKCNADAIKPEDLRLLAPIMVHNSKLAEAQKALEDCLRKNKTLENRTPNIDYGKLTADLPDPETPFISPFDRRLDRLVIDGDNAYGIIPISTAYAQAGTIGYTVSEAFIRSSKVQKQQELIEKKVRKDVAQMQNDDFFVGVPALMNNYAYVKLYGSKGGRYLVNLKGKRKWYEVDQTVGPESILNFSQNPTTSSLISWGNGDPYGRTPYNFTDFVFNKHWNKVPNNRLITLRRYAAPIVDNLKFPGMDGTQSTGTPAVLESNGNEPKVDQNGNVIETTASGIADGGSAKKIIFPPMASAITYFGDETDNKLGDILKFTTGFEWDEAEADVWKVTPTETPNAEQGPGALWPGFTSLAKSLNVALGNWDQDAALNKGQLPPDPYVDGPYENRIIGPVNRITKVKKRKPGIKFEMNNIELKFDYVARPIGGVNSKAVLLDILSNFLILGSTAAVFWGGQHRFMGNPQTYPFLGGDKGIQQWYSGKPLEWGATTIHDFLGKSATAGGNLLEMAKNFFNSMFSKPGCTGDLYGSLMSAYSSSPIPGNLIKQYAAEKSNGQIPYLQTLKALLIGEPVGEWHITIGNPLNPIAMIGNLVCESVEVEFGNELGPDDFPLEMRITVKLAHGMARDRDAIQSIFNRGMGRIYDLPDSFRGSAEGESKIDNVTGNAPSTGRNPVYYKVPIANSGTVGGKYGTSKVVDNAMAGNVSVWNRMQYTAVSPNSDQILRTKDNPLFRSSYRAVDWVALKSLK